ncbi:FLYWCH zinc finger domain-containing protein [Phthorimaea operculella]|nr:FLYWCH zinc finger domain-containing protein [Phthorimaea operculella]
MASISKSDLIIFCWVKNGAGKQLALINGFTYYLGKKGTKTNFWRCTKGASCKARFILNKQMNMISCNLQHDHTPPRYIIRNVSWVLNTSGKQIAVIGGYTFYHNTKGGVSWRCTKGHPCKARFVIDQNGIFGSANLVHTHNAPKFIIKDGVCMSSVYIQDIHGGVESPGAASSSVGAAVSRLQTSSAVGAKHTSAKIIISRRGKRLLEVGGYTFYSRRNTGSSNKWMCTMNIRKSCHAEVYTYNNEIVKIHNVHTHDKPN